MACMTMSLTCRKKIKMRNRKRKGVYRIIISVENLTSPSAKKSSVCHFITGCTYFDCESEKRVQSRLIIHGDNIQLHGTELACMDGCGLQIHFLSSISALSSLIPLFFNTPDEGASPICHISKYVNSGRTYCM